MRRSLLIAAKAFTLVVAAGGLALAVWQAEGGSPALTAEPPMPAKEAKATPSEPRAAAPDPKRYGIYGPDSKADPHMARAAALREYHRLRDSGAATAEASDDAGVAEGASTLENLQYLPGSKSGFGGLGLRGQKRLPRGPKPGLGKPPKGKAP